MKRNLVAGAALAAAVWGTVLAQGEVVISELMYHPASEDPGEEFIELHNPGVHSVPLAGWTLSAGVRYRFPPVSLPAGGYLVVAADVAKLQALHPGLVNIVGNWEGILSNSGEKVELSDSQGRVVCAVHYADEGDWGPRILAEPDHGHRGWDWISPADGGGPSLELINPALPVDCGQNWAPSLVAGGTPGAPNTVAAADIAPLIQGAAHFPPLPHADEQVVVTARVTDEAGQGVTVTLHHRPDGEAGFATTAMLDDGRSGDGAPNDGVFGALLPPRPDGAIVEFYLSAVDAGGNLRTWPAPAEVDGAPQQVANALYQVVDTVPPEDLPTYWLILRGADRDELEQINRGRPEPPFPAGDQTQSHAQFNGTFISFDGAGTAVRYRVGIRNRGHGSRRRQPQSFRVNIPNDAPWKGVSAINLNSQQPHAQLFGSALYRRAGLPTQEARAVHVRLNGADLALESPAPFPFYVGNEVLDSDFARRQFPRDSSGNIYRGKRQTGKGADLHYEGPDPDPYRQNYFKQTNTSADDWSDLIELTQVLDEAPPETYVEEVRRVVNVEEWMLYFALESLVDNGETNLANSNQGTGAGDDYLMYRGVLDPRFQLLPYDLDTILGEGGSGARIDDSLFRMTDVKVLDPFMKQPEFARVYFATLDRLVNTLFTEAELRPLMQQVIGHLTDADTVEAMLGFGVARADWVRGRLHPGLSATSDLPVVDGLPQTSEATVSLNGTADLVRTREVRVNGQPAAWSAWEGTWSADNVPLRAGENSVLVQALDMRGEEFARTRVLIRRTGNGGASHAGTLAADETWSAAASPHQVNATVIVPAGRTLTIEAGATVYFAAAAGLEVRGRLAAEGTDLARIRFAPRPGGGAWGPLEFQGATADNRLVNVDFDRAGAGAHALGVEASRLWIQGCVWSGIDDTIIETTDSTLDVRDSVFPTISQHEIIHGNGMPAEGHVIIAGNFFGSTTGYSDVIDFTGGRRPGPILQVLDNIFSGGSDDALDLDGTDAHVEGNIFTHFHQDQPRPSTSNAIATDSRSEIVSARNLFFDNDHAALLKNGAFLVSQNDTIVGSTLEAINFGEPERGVPPGRGADLAGTIVWGNAALFGNLTPPDATVTVTADHCILQDTNWPGPANLSLDPRLTDMAGADWNNLRRAFSLRPGSPAKGSGPFGLDRGGLAPGGVAIGDGPAERTHASSATFTLGGPGLIQVRWRLDGGAWSDPQPAGATVELTGLDNGPHRLEAVGQNSAGVWQTEAEAAFREWTVDPGHGGVRLNELLARNDTAFEHAGTFPDYLELHNDSGAPVDLAGMGISTDPARPHAFQFPAGTVLEAGGFLLLLADKNANAPGLHLGFTLDRDGGTVMLSAAPANGGGPLDQVTYGVQIPDRSIGRDTRGDWTLTLPTPGAPNAPLRLGDPARLRLNEWLPASAALFLDDYLELYNGDDLPVALGGLWLSDNPIGWPDRYVFPPLSFIGARSSLRFAADGSTAGGRHLPFRLAAEQGMLGLVRPDGRPIDRVVYESPWPDQAQGRLPDGGDSIGTLPVPSPGGANPALAGGITNIVTETLPLLPMTNTWRYHQTGPAPADWTAPGFNDADWPTGAALLYHESSGLPAPKNTELDLGQITYYFRTQFTAPELQPGQELRAYTVVDDGLVVWLNGQEWFRDGMPSGPVTHDTRANTTVGNAGLNGPRTLPPGPLVAGENTLAVEVHQHSSSSSDIVFGLALALSRSTTNVVGSDLSLRLNELLAANTRYPHTDGPPTDWVELFNRGDAPADLEGCSLTDDPEHPRRWVFASGTMIPARGYLTLACNPAAPAAADNTGFGLRREGGQLYLFDRPENGGGLLDGLTYGLQTTDFSLARTEDGKGDWGLATPTPGAGNTPAPLGDPAGLRINEWMARPLAGADWLELYNPADRPVPLAGLRLSDDLNDRDQFRFPPLSFLGAGANAFLQLKADNDPAQGADHLPFKLSGKGEAIGLFDVRGWPLDAVIFGPQADGISEGRLPDGADAVIRAFIRPTPGASNEPVPDWDWDNDRLPNDWETAHGLDPHDPADAALDGDGDGLSNWAEFQAGTNPGDPTSNLRLEAATVSPQEPATATLRFNAVAGHSYSVLFTDALSAGAGWQKVGDVTADCTCPVEVTDANPPAATARFYQVVTPALPNP